MMDTMPSITRVQKRQTALPGPMRLNVEGSAGAWPGDNSNQCSQGYNCPPPSVPPITPYSPIQSRYFEISAGGPTAFDWTATVTGAPWLHLSETGGHISDPSTVQRVYMTVDWSAVPKGTAQTATIALKPSTGQSTSVTIIANSVVVPGDFHGFVEDNGVVSIQTEHWSRETAVDGVHWEVLPGYGKNLSAISPQIVVDSRWAAGSGPSVEYDFYTFNSKGGNVTVTVFSSPSLNTYPGHPLMYGVAVDSGAPIAIQPIPVDTPTGGFPAMWNGIVPEEIVRTYTTHVAGPGKHTLKLYAMEIGFVTEKVVIETATGAVPYSYLGPPESIVV